MIIMIIIMMMMIIIVISLSPKQFSRSTRPRGSRPARFTANVRTKILDVRGFYSSRIVDIRGGIIMPIGNLLDISSQPQVAA